MWINEREIEPVYTHRLKMNEIMGLIFRCFKFYVTCNAARFSSAKFVVREVPPLQIFLKM